MNRSARHFILKNKDFYSFYAGIVVSGYVVSISMNPDKNIFHWTTIGLGSLIGLFCHILVKISNRFQEKKNVLNNKNPDINSRELDLTAWKEINNSEYPSTRIFLGFRPKHLIYTLFLGIFSLTLLTAYTLKLAMNSEQNEQTITNKQLINHIDSLSYNTTKLVESKFVEIEESVIRNEKTSFSRLETMEKKVDSNNKIFIGKINSLLKD